MERYDYHEIEFTLSEFNTVFDILLIFKDLENKDAISFYYSVSYFIFEDNFSRLEDDHTEFLRKIYGL